MLNGHQGKEVPDKKNPTMILFFLITRIAFSFPYDLTVHTWLVSVLICVMLWSITK